jgi:hypothetical protein
LIILHNFNKSLSSIVLYHYVFKIRILLAHTVQNPNHSLAESDLYLILPIIRVIESFSKIVDSVKFNLICDFCVKIERKVKKALAERANSALDEVKSKRIWDADIHYDD